MAVGFGFEPLVSVIGSMFVPRVVRKVRLPVLFYGPLLFETEQPSIWMMLLVMARPTVVSADMPGYRFRFVVPAQ